MIHTDRPLSLDVELPTLGVEEEFLIVDPATCLPLPVAREVSTWRTASAPSSSRRSLACRWRAPRRCAGGCGKCGDTCRPRGPSPPLRHCGPTGSWWRWVSPWRGRLPVLLALTANSPIHHGVDTGYASWRSVLTSRWPCSRAPPCFTSAEHYDEMTGLLVDSGAVLDRAMIYWDVRPSDHLPTVEVRVCDVPATVGETVLLAVLVRALVITAVRATERGERAVPVSDQALRAARWRAADDGITGQGIDLFNNRRTPAVQLLRKLVREAGPVLRQTGELRAVNALLTKVFQHGNGAARQRQAFQRHGRLEDVLAVLDRATGQDCRPDTAA